MTWCIPNRITLRLTGMPPIEESVHWALRALQVARSCNSTEIPRPSPWRPWFTAPRRTVFLAGWSCLDQAGAKTWVSWYCQTCQVFFELTLQCMDVSLPLFPCILTHFGQKALARHSQVEQCLLGYHCRQQMAVQLVPRQWCSWPVVRAGPSGQCSECLDLSWSLNNEQWLRS